MVKMKRAHGTNHLCVKPLWLLPLLACLAFNVKADPSANTSCMVPPVGNKSGFGSPVVSSRFGKFRGEGETHGSAVTKPHMHGGLDFSTDGQSKPVYASTEGKIAAAHYSSSAGNMIIIERPSGDKVLYAHLSNFAKNPATKRSWRIGDAVNPGDVLGLSGNTPSEKMAKHLHLGYGVPDRADVKSAQFNAQYLAKQGVFKPDSLTFVYKNGGGYGYITDPSPYFCDTFPIVDGHAHGGVLGGDTKAQFNLVFSSLPSGGAYGEAPVGYSAAAIQEGMAAHLEENLAGGYLQQGEMYGALPLPPFEDYEAMSPLEMILSEGARRFGSSEWNENLAKASVNSLWIDYNRASASSLFVESKIREQNERIEALLAAATLTEVRAIQNALKRMNQAARLQDIKS